MRIAMLAPLSNPILINQKYGGIERIVKSLVKKLCSKGCRITLYALSETDLNYPNLEVIRYKKFGRSLKVLEQELFKRIIKDQNRYDLIHSHLEPIIGRSNYGNYFLDIKKPLLFTFHNLTNIREHINYYRHEKKLWEYMKVFISYAQAKPLDFFPQRRIIYNGIDLNGIKYSSNSLPRQLAFLGRIMPEKGIGEAISLAKRLDMNLIIGAKVDDLNHQYFTCHIEPEINGRDIKFLGEIDSAQKNLLLGKSLASLFLISLNESFGLSVVESLAAGTPVIATRRGALPEIIEDGKSGIIIPDGCNEEGCADLFLNKIHDINRQDCRHRAEQFSEERMADNYLALYKEMLSGAKLSPLTPMNILDR